MIKAEVVEYPGAEVPNWVAKCRDILTSAPAIGTVSLVLVAIAGLVFWHGHKPSFTDTTGLQSLPAPTSSLQVTSSTDLPIPTASTISPAQTTPTGPAPSNSRDSLQPTGLVNTGAPGLTQAAQSIQNAGHASERAVDNLNL